MKTITVKVGQSVEFHVPVIGEPPPEMEWTFNGRAVEDCFGKTVTIKNEEYKTNFVLRSALREHAGTYLLTATNINGTDKNGVEVIVIGKPLAPEGPLEVSNVLADSCTLDWKPPAVVSVVEQSSYIQF